MVEGFRVRYAGVSTQRGSNNSLERPNGLSIESMSLFESPSLDFKLGEESEGKAFHWSPFERCGSKNC